MCITWMTPQWLDGGAIDGMNCQPAWKGLAPVNHRSFRWLIPTSHTPLHDGHEMSWFRHLGLLDGTGCEHCWCGNPANQLRPGEYAIFHRASGTTGGAGFLPSTVSLQMSTMMIDDHMHFNFLQDADLNWGVYRDFPQEGVKTPTTWECWAYQESIFRIQEKLRAVSSLDWNLPL